MDATLAEKTGRRTRFNREARELFLSLAMRRDAAWRGNFRDLSASVTRMSVLAGGGRITTDIVQEEWKCLTERWDRLGGAEHGEEEALLAAVLGPGARELDLFDAAQLACVIRACRRAHTLSEAGRLLFARSREQKKHVNDADRLRKYLAKFGLDWETVTAFTYERRHMFPDQANAVPQEKGFWEL